MIEGLVGWLVDWLVNQLLHRQHHDVCVYVSFNPCRSQRGEHVVGAGLPSKWQWQWQWQPQQKADSDDDVSSSFSFFLPATP